MTSEVYCELQATQYNVIEHICALEFHNYIANEAFNFFLIYKSRAVHVKLL